MEMMDEKMMAREQAKPLRMLSAYLTTTATSNPPVAFIPTRYITNRSYLNFELQVAIHIQIRSYRPMYNFLSSIVFADPECGIINESATFTEVQIKVCLSC